MDSTKPWMLLFWSSIVFGSVLLSFLVIVSSHGNKHKRRLPPGPSGWPILGNFFDLGKRPHESLFHLARKYGPLMTLRLGMKTTVVVSSPAMPREILSKNDHTFAGRTVSQAAKCVSFWKSSLVFNPYGDRWRMLRRICSVELLCANRLNTLQHLRRDQVFEAVRQIYQEDYLKDRTVNIGRVAFFVSFNLMGNMIFGRNMFQQNSDAAEDFKKNVSKTMELFGAPNLADFFPFLQILDPQGICRDLTVYMKQVFALFDNFIDERISLSPHDGSFAVGHCDFLDVLLGYIRDVGDESTKFTRADITPLLYTLFLAGAETSGTTVEWAMAELIRNPNIMKRAQAELEEVVGRHRQVEESDIQRLPYLNAVVKEAFRLHPPVPLLLPHRAENSCDIAGFFIPKHSQILVNVWGWEGTPWFGMRGLQNSIRRSLCLRRERSITREMTLN